MSENKYRPHKLPPQLLPFNRKTRIWRKANIDCADSLSYINYSPVRNSVKHKKLNYDLIRGRVNMQDLSMLINPDGIDALYIPKEIVHYPIMNSKLNLLAGEESDRVFDYKVVVTNPNAITEMENEKKLIVFTKLLELVSNSAQSEEEFNQRLDELLDYMMYEYQDFREVRGNCVLKHYETELNFKNIFHAGFYDAMTVAEEIYRCSIIGGEPVLEKLDPIKVRVYRSGISNRIEDADMIVIEDYWSPGKIYDTFYNVLTEKDRKYIETAPHTEGRYEVDSMGNLDERGVMVRRDWINDDIEGNTISLRELFNNSSEEYENGAPFDAAGNIRVLQVYWKSRRKIKKVKSYDPETGEEQYDFYPENYIINKDLGEEELIMWINEAWEGTKIGKDIYVNMRPCLVQYNRLSNPSRCHFGIIGSVYNINNGKPYSLVDLMKKYNYLYDVYHARLNKAIADNWGNIMELDLAQVPDGWDVDKWMYFARVNKIAVKDSFNVGSEGAALGILSGNFANNSRGMLSTNDGNYILQLVNLLEFTKLEMSEVTGISKQREGLISNRETVGGIERSTLQSSHITEWLFVQHEDVKRRVYECYLETAKIAMRGSNKKFWNILPDHSRVLVEIDGDLFAECDYGLCIDSSNNAQLLNRNIDALALAALQNQALSFTSIMKLYSSASIAEKERMIQKEEFQKQQLAQLLLMQLQRLQEQLLLALALQELAKLAHEDALNIRDNETKIIIASMGQDDGIQEPVYSLEAKDKLQESIRQFNAKLALENKKLDFEKEKSRDEITLKKQLINKLTTINK